MHTPKLKQLQMFMNKVYQEIRMQSVVFVTLRIPNNETEIPLTKK